jgi:hypothetical protein
LILTPLAVGPQFVREGEKFGIECKLSRNGQVKKGINVTNYEQLKKYNPSDFEGLVCDESSILKGMDSKTRTLVTEFAKKVKYRLLCTATPAPNDYKELGCSSEALGVMGQSQMLGMFFINGGEDTQQWTLKPHAKRRYWEWLCSWARAIRKPSDIGFSDEGFILPPLNLKQHLVGSSRPYTGLFPTDAITLEEQRAERKATLKERCELVASLVPKDRPALIWCHMNLEGDLLERLIPDSIQVAGSDSNEVKEERLNGFSLGKYRILITKPKIGGFGMNWQHCSDMFTFPSHSFESYYQSIRRCWRFGQKNPVTVHIVTSKGESKVLKNMQRKEKQAEDMFRGIVSQMDAYQNRKQKKNSDANESIKLPTWIKS